MNFNFDFPWAALNGNINPETMMWASWIFWAIFWWLAMIQMIIMLAVIALMIVSRWRIFSKAWLPGWGIFIPFYNRVLMFKVGGLSGRWTLSIVAAIILGNIAPYYPEQLIRTILFFIALLLFGVIMIINYFKIALKFWKHWTYGLGILFLKVIFIPILAFSKSTYLGKKTVTKKAAPAAKPTTKKAVTKKRVKKPVAKKSATPVKKVKTLINGI